jgi:hypothetical protein
MTEDELEAIRALGRAEGRRSAREDGPLDPAVVDRVNQIFAPAIRAVQRRHEEESP